MAKRHDGVGTTGEFGDEPILNALATLDWLPRLSVQVAAAVCRSVRLVTEIGYLAR